MPAHIRKKENEERVREKGGNGERHSAYVYIMHIYKAYIHQLGIMKGGRKGEKGGNQSILSGPWVVYVDIYLKVLLISVCLEVNVYVIYSI